MFQGKKKTAGRYVVAPFATLQLKHYERFAKRGIQLSPERVQNLALISTAHETAEAYYGEQQNRTYQALLAEERLAKQLESPELKAITARRKAAAAKVRGERFGSHVSEEVVRSDLEVARRLGPQTLEDYITWRGWEADALQKEFDKSVTGNVPWEQTKLGKQGHRRDVIARYLARGKDMFAEYKQLGAIAPPGEPFKLPSIPEVAHRDWEAEWAWHDKFMLPDEAFAPSRAKPVPRVSPGPSLWNRLSTRTKVLGGVGLTAAAILTAAAFSGKDDNYNTIEGLPEFGLAKQQRRILTDFGSGWQGIAAERTTNYGVLLARELVEWSDDFARFYFTRYRNQSGNEQAFSGQDDGYNKLQGMRHGGFAQRQRRIFTEFGSGWLGQTIRELKEIGTKFIRSPNIGAATETLAEGVGGIGLKIHVNPQIHATTVSQALGRELSPIEQKLAGRLGLFHEAREAKLYAREIEKMPGGMETWEKMSHAERELWDRSLMERTVEKYGTTGHLNFSVVADELTWAKSQGEDMYRLALEIRQKEASKFLGEARTLRSEVESGFAWDEGDALKKAAGRERMARILDRLTTMHSAGRLPRYNGPKVVPDGLSRGGMAHTKRKVTGSPFQSPASIFGRAANTVKGWFGRGGAQTGRELGALAAERVAGAGTFLHPAEAAKMAQGRSLEEFASLLQQRLGSGIDIGVLRGVEGQRQWQTMIESAKKNFGITVPGGAFSVEREGRQFVRLNVEKLQESYLTGTPGKLARAAVSEDVLKTTLYHEVLEAQSKLFLAGRATPAASSHASAHVIVGEGGFLEALGNKEAKSFFQYARKRLGKAGKEFQWEHKALREGFSAFSEGTKSSELRRIVSDFGSGYRGLLESTSRSIAKTNSTVGRASQKLTESAQDLKMAQRFIWEAGIRGGKGHTKYAGSHVKQLSRFGGGI